MKVLWITNILFEHHRTMMGLDSSTVVGGGWLNAAYASSLGVKDLQLHIVTVANIPCRMVGGRDGHFFYILPGGGTRNYDIDSQNNIHEWETLRAEIQPDLMLVWGTETRFAYLAMRVMRGIPSAVYMQGVISSISSHYYEGVPYGFQCKTMRDFLNRIDKSSEIRHFARQTKLEKEMLKMADSVIVENDWCEDVCHVVNPSLKIFRNNLPIRNVFYQGGWNLDKMVPFTIFTNAGGYPIKGHHILFQALAKVRCQFPNFKCYVPGTNLAVFDSLKRRTGYSSYLNKILKENDLLDNVIYTGPLSSEEMVKQLELCNVYVMPSIVENHSSSLIEAMIVGSPCISSLVGGVASLVIPGQNALLYNSLDSDSLAGCIIRVFSSNVLAKKLSDEAYMIRRTRTNAFGGEILKLYSYLRGL